MVETGMELKCLAVRLVGSMDDVRYCEMNADVVLGADNIQMKEQSDDEGIKEGV